MNLFSFLFMLTSLSNKTYLYKKPILNCKDCVFYMQDYGKDKNGVPLCKKYGEKDSFTGKIIFYEASKCRDDVFRCGEDAKHFIQKNTL